MMITGPPGRAYDSMARALHFVALAGNAVHCSQGARSETVICPVHMHVIQRIERYLASTLVLLSAGGRTGMQAVVLLLVIFYATTTDEHSGCVTSSGATTGPSFA